MIIRDSEIATLRGTIVPLGAPTHEAVILITPYGSPPAFLRQ
jgi:hypothetical protein